MDEDREDTTEEGASAEEERRMALEEARNGAVDTADADGDTEPQAEGDDAGQQPKQRLTPFEGGLMIGVAFLFDAAEVFFDFILIGFVINPVLSVIAWLTFFVWFHSKGMSSGLSLKGGFTSIMKNPMFMNAATLAVELLDQNLLVLEKTVGIAIVVFTELAEQQVKKTGVGKALEKAHVV